VTTGFLYGTNEIIISVVFLVLMLVATPEGLVQRVSSKSAPESGGEVRELSGGWMWVESRCQKNSHRPLDTA
jgi:hypothetical protein